MFQAWPLAVNIIYNLSFMSTRNAQIGGKFMLTGSDHPASLYTTEYNLK